MRSPICAKAPHLLRRGSWANHSTQKRIGKRARAARVRGDANLSGATRGHAASARERWAGVLAKRGDGGCDAERAQKPETELPRTRACWEVVDTDDPGAAGHAIQRVAVAGMCNDVNGEDCDALGTTSTLQESTHPEANSWTRLRRAMTFDDMVQGHDGLVAHSLVWGARAESGICRWYVLVGVACLVGALPHHGQTVESRAYFAGDDEDMRSDIIQTWTATTTTTTPIVVSNLNTNLSSATQDSKRATYPLAEAWQASSLGESCISSSSGRPRRAQNRTGRKTCDDEELRRKPNTPQSSDGKDIAEARGARLCERCKFAEESPKTSPTPPHRDSVLEHGPWAPPNGEHRPPGLAFWDVSTCKPTRFLCSFSDGKAGVLNLRIRECLARAATAPGIVQEGVWRWEGVGDEHGA